MATLIACFQRRARLPLLVLLVLAAGLSVCWNVALPPLQGPDELEHIAYVEAIGENGTIPWTAVHAGNHCPPICPLPGNEVVAAVAGNFVDMRGNPALPAPESAVDVTWWSRAEAARTGGTAVGSVRIMVNPPLAYLYLTPWYLAASHEGFFAQVFYVRLANIPLLFVVIAATWGLLGLVFAGRKSLQLLGTSAVAVQPQLIHMSAVVSPDLFLAALWATALYLGVLLVECPPTRWRVVAMVLLGLAGPLTHARGLALAPVAVIALLLTWSRWRADTSSRRRAAWIAVATVAASSAFFALLYAYRFSLSILEVRQAVSYLWQFYLPRAPYMTSGITHGWEVRNVVVDRFFSGFANYEVSFTPEVLRALGWTAAAIVAAAAIGVVLQREAVARHARAAIFVVLSGVVGALWLHAPALRTLAEGGADPLLTGRYVLPFVALYGLAIALAVSWVPGRVGGTVGGALLATLATVQIGAFATLVERFYG